MDFPLKETLGATATLLVAAVGYRQWIRGRRSGQYLAEKERSYKEIWDALETANLYVREGNYTRDVFREKVRAANALVLRYGLYFEEADRPKVSRYLTALEETGRILTTDRADKAFDALRSGMYSTAAEPLELEDLVPEYRTAIRELDESRRAVVRAFQDHIGRPYA